MELKHETEAKFNLPRFSLHLNGHWQFFPCRAIKLKNEGLSRLGLQNTKVFVLATKPHIVAQSEPPAQWNPSISVQPPNPMIMLGRNRRVRSAIETCSLSAASSAGWLKTTSITLPSESSVAKEVVF